MLDIFYLLCLYTYVYTFITFGIWCYSYKAKKVTINNNFKEIQFPMDKYNLYVRYKF